MENDTFEDQQRHRQILNQENQIRQQCQTQNQAQASIPGTWQHEALMEINRNIDEQNIREGREGWRKRCRRAPQQEFRDEQFQYCSKGGVNWVAYGDRVLNPFLYPWIDQLQAQTGMPVTYLVEDTVPAHQTVQRVDHELCHTKGIITF